MTAKARASLERHHQELIRAPLASRRPADRISALEEIVERWRNGVGMALIEQTKAPERYAAVVAWLDGAIADVLRLDDALAALRPAPGPAIPADLEHRIAATFAAVARGVGAMIVDGDGLCVLTLQYADPADRQMIAALGPLKLGGRLLIPSMQGELLERYGVVALVVDGERRYRLIDLNRLTTHAAIYRQVTTNQAGSTCRFCGIREPGPGRALLVAAEQSERTSGMTLDVNGRRIDLHAKHGYVHRGKCLERWIECVAIARQYESEEAAEEADRQAGREAVDLPPAPVFAAEPEPAAEPAATPPRDYYESGSRAPIGEPPVPQNAYRTALERRRARKGLTDGN